MADKDITPKIKALPNMNLQTDRLMEKHQFHCPKCGKISPVNYVPVDEKTADMCDIVMHCNVCSDTVLEQRYVKHKSQTFIKGTETKYDRTKWLRDAEKKMKIVNTPNESQIHKEALSVLDGMDDDDF